MRFAPLLLLSFAFCEATTTRPPFAPLPDASKAEVRLTVAEATRVLAAALRADSFPLSRVEERDGWLESDWFRFPDYTPVPGRALGPTEDKLRAWVDPRNPGPPATSLITIEVVYRLLEDPSRPDREAERHVHESHTVRLKALGVLRRLVQEHGDPDAARALDSTIAPPPPPPPPPVTDPPTP